MLKWFSALSGKTDPAALSQRVLRRVLEPMEEYRRRGQVPLGGDDLHDFLLWTADVGVAPAQLFDRLRWGGVAVVAGPDAGPLQRAAENFTRSGFAIEQVPTPLAGGWSAWPFRGRHGWYFLARKLQLIAPGSFTDRFTYQVELELGSGGEYHVCKRVPSLEMVSRRLERRWPELPREMLLKRARKFTEKIFPTFLTREAAILMILQQHLPAAYGRRVPRVLGIEKDIRGFVRTLRMNWLRNGGTPLSQLDFALQSADLLRMVHERADVIHLDLRLDNFVISDGAVGFVDFGSAVRGDEDISQNPLLATLFGELMRTSQIQRMLDKMTRSGHVTAEHFRRSRGKVDKSVDLFYLALQFNRPHDNPDLAGLIEFDPQSDQARALRRLTQSILKPADPAHPAIQSASDVLRALKLMQKDR